MNESLVKYLAGLLDADGSLSFSFRRDQDERRRDTNYFGLALRLTSSTAVDKNGFVASLPTLTGMGSVTRDGDKNQFAIWSVSKRSDLEMLLPRLIKHMVIKGAHWNWLLEFWREKRGTAITDRAREAMTAASKESRKLRVGPLRPKNHPTWAWVAGYLDGDGCYSHRSGVYNGYRQWTMNVSAVAHQNDMVVLEFLEKAFGGRIEGQGQSDHVFIWIRSLGYQNRSFALRFLPKVAKHSRLKRHKIDAMIHHHRQRLSVPGTERTFCTVEGCNGKGHGNGLCSKHYQRQWKQSRQVQATV